jgi:hypothetical protein
LNETDRDKKEGASVHALEDNHADSPFVLPKIPPQEESSGFQSGKCKHKNKARTLKYFICTFLPRLPILL